MKLSLSTLLAATMMAVGSSESSVEFDSIAFIQYSGTCDGEVLYDGEITGIKKLDEGKFCVSDILHAPDGDKEVFSRLDIVTCTADKVYENWLLCEDKDCASCNLEYRAYTTWDNVHPEDMMGHCYDYQFSTDDMVALQRNVLGPLDNTKSVDYMFGSDANEADVAAYRGFIHDNSCIGIGQASPENVDLPTEDVDVSASSSFGFTTSLIAMSWAVPMLLA